jgi:outer membrane protein assembly factor BamE
MLIKKIIVTIFLITSLSGCSFLYNKFVYQIDVTQGNYIEEGKIKKLELGMTQDQVIFLLGSPMLIDEFNPSKWYYIRYIKPGGKAIHESKVVLSFHDKKLISISKDGKIEKHPLTMHPMKAAPNAAAENNKGDSGRRAKVDSARPIIENDKHKPIYHSH